MTCSTIRLVRVSVLAALIGVIAPASRTGATEAGTANWKDNFEAYPAGQPLGAQGGWVAEPSAVVVNDIAHSGKKSVKVAPPPGEVRFITLLQRSIPIGGTPHELWSDIYIRTPQKPQVLMVELQKGGKMLSAVGFGIGEAGFQFQDGYLLRTSRGGSITSPRNYQRKVNPYTGESFEIRPEKWVRLTTRLDFKNKQFDVYRDGKAIFTDLEMAPLPDDGEVRLRILTVPSAEAETAAFYVDDSSVGVQRPQGLEPTTVYPPRPAEAKLRVVVVGDTQLHPNAAKQQEDINGAMNTIATEINQLNPELVIFVGDLISRGDRNADIMYPVWLNGAKKIKAPYYTTPGNHDPHAVYQQYIRKDLDYSFEKNGVTFIGFSSSHPSDVDGWDHQGQVSPQQLAWLEEEMKKARARGNQIVTFTHITSHPNKRPLRGWYIREGGEQLRALYQKYSVAIEISGHMHRWLASWKEGPTHYIVAPAVAQTTGSFAGMMPGHGLMIYDFLQDKVLQYEKPAKMPYFTTWGEWAEHELALPRNSGNER